MKSVRGNGPVVKGGCPGIFHRKWQLRRRREPSLFAKYLETLYWSHPATFVKEKVNSKIVVEPERWRDDVRRQMYDVRCKKEVGRMRSCQRREHGCKTPPQS